MNCDIVVSYYNNNNFLKLLDLFENGFLYKYQAVVYNKSGCEITKMIGIMIHQMIQECIR